MAWLSIDQKREEISRVYPADWWRMKVYGMPDHQVAAIYNRMLASGELKEPEIKQLKKIETPPATWGKTMGERQGMQTAWKLKCVTEEDVPVGEQIRFKI